MLAKGRISLILVVGLDAVEAGNLDVHRDDGSNLVLARGLDGVRGVVRLDDDVNPVLVFQLGAQTLPEDGMVVHHQGDGADHSLHYLYLGTGGSIATTVPVGSARLTHACAEFLGPLPHRGDAHPALAGGVKPDAAADDARDQ